MKRTGPELEYWIEVWGIEADDEALRWQFHSTHETRPEAIAQAEVMHAMRGLKVRVLEVARWQLLVFG